MSRLPNPVDIWCADCGLPHTDEQRERVVRRMPSASAADLVLAYPCLFQNEKLRRKAVQKVRGDARRAA